jgi:hypothetical protein
VLDGYYKSSQFIVTAETRLSGSTELSAKQAKVKNNYTLLDEVPSDDNYVITLIVRGAEKSVNVSSYITENKVFTDINTLDATISRDSAFTTYFNVSNYDKYEELSIKFNEYLPKGTSIILIDKSNAGVMHLLVSNGERVSKNGTIAKIFASEKDSFAVTEIEKIKE